mmetsp:Transcript_24991/g.78470  ORF Transcript_24991/g.78470 Transcript_24991/m.78470 type:complete len:210 (+) Transcript_24991:376-1005(+)
MPAPPGSARPRSGRPASSPGRRRTEGRARRGGTRLGRSQCWKGIRCPQISKSSWLLASARRRWSRGRPRPWRCCPPRPNMTRRRPRCLPCCRGSKGRSCPQVRAAWRRLAHPGRCSPRLSCSSSGRGAAESARTASSQQCQPLAPRRPPVRPRSPHLERGAGSSTCSQLAPTRPLHPCVEAQASIPASSQRVARAWLTQSTQESWLVKW